MAQRKIQTSVGMETADETYSRAKSLLAGGSSSSSGSNKPSTSYKEFGSPTASNFGGSSVGSGNRELDSIMSESTNVLGNYVGDMGTFKDREKTILQNFSDRRRLAQEGGSAERSLIGEDSAFKIDEQLGENARNITNSLETRSGFATQKVALDFLVDTGKKRVTELEKQRDSLLLQSKVAEAGRLDSLIMDEQEAITNARTSFVNEIMNIGRETRDIAGEERAQASFETPEQTRSREFEYGQYEAQNEAIRTLQTTAPDAGITGGDSFETAVSKYRNSDAYKNNKRLGELEIAKMEADIANTKSITSDRTLGGGSGTGGGTLGGGIQYNTDGTYASDLDAFMGNVLNTIPSENGKEAFLNTLNSARNDADRLNAVASVVLTNAPAEVRNDFILQQGGISSIDQAINYLDQGTKTGVINAGQQYVYNAFGKDFDPNLAAIDAYITSAIQPYRSSITGAAWGRQEDNEYNQLFGNTKYSPKELRERLVRIKEIMKGKSASALAGMVAPVSGFNPFNEAGQPASEYDDWSGDNL